MWDLEKEIINKIHVLNYAFGVAISSGSFIVALLCGKKNRKRVAKILQESVQLAKHTTNILNMKDRIWFSASQVESEWELLLMFI